MTPVRLEPAALWSGVKHSTTEPLRSLFTLGLYGLISMKTHVLFLFLFDLILYVPVNSYGHVRTVSSHNHTFFLGKLDYAVHQYFMHILSLVTDNNPS